MTVPDASAPPADTAAGPHRPQVNRARDAADLLKHIAKEEQEHFYVLGLDNKHRVLTQRCVAMGTVNAVTVAARDIFRELIRHNCVAFIAAHNHPSGDPHPSGSDLQLTLELQLAGALLDICLLDHVIIAADCFYSTREEALYPFAV